MSFSQFRALLFHGKRPIVLILSITLLFFFYGSLPAAHLEKLQQMTVTIRQGTSTQSPFGNRPSHQSIIANGTLGFGAIMVLGLPSRFDRRDALELAASFTNLNLTWVDGVLGDTMNPKAIPPAHTDNATAALKTDGEIGSWRGHMDVMRNIVKQKISTALILEDDADWDINVVQQMQTFAAASKQVLAQLEPLPGRSKSGSPYGDGWDILWIGHCGGKPPLDNSFPRAIITNDSTVPPSWDIMDLLKDANPNNCTAHKGRDPQGMTCNKPRLADTDRIVQYKGKPTCATAYAVSYQGARKMLARMGGVSLIDVDTPVDIEMGDMCRETESEKGASKWEIARCLSVSPPYISTHQPRGLLPADGQKKGSKKDTGVAKGLVFSTRLNIENLVGQYEPESQYVKDGDGAFRYRRAKEYRSGIKNDSPYH